MPELIGRRLPATLDGKLPFHGVVTKDWRPGDYCGPVRGYTGDKPSVHYVLPNAEPDENGHYPVHHVTSPPHTFRECADGSLEIRNSILHRGWIDEAHPDGEWHGFLNEGHRWTW